MAPGSVSPGQPFDRRDDPFASVMEGTPVVMALLSYAGSLHIGIDTDPEAIPDPQRIADLFEANVAMLEALGR